MSKNTPSIVFPLPFRMFILLIDADNTPADFVPQMMQKIEEWGIPTIRRVYANQEMLQNKKWKDLCLRYAFQPMPHIGISGAKNATDIALTVDAMDLLWLHKESHPYFCLITGDQDFTALVLRLRNQGCNVYCIGKIAKSEALAKVSTHFLSTEHFVVPTALPLPEPSPDPPPASSTKKAKKTKQQTSQLDPKLKKFLTTTVAMISAENLEKDKPEWVSMAPLGARLKLLDPQFQAKTYGYKTLAALFIDQPDLFEHRQEESHLDVRVKQPTKQSKKKGKK